MQPYHAGKTCQQVREHREAAKCRFCDTKLPAELADGHVCNEEQCQVLLKLSCTKTHACGHLCKGFKDEAECLPCLDEQCAKNHGGLLEDVNDDNYCNICWSEKLGNEPCVMLGCKHVFHLRCIEKIVKDKWLTPRIVFNFLECPSCK